MTKLVLLLVVLLIAGCTRDRDNTSPSTRPALGARSTHRGTAENHKVGPFLRGPGIYVDLPKGHWPSDAVGRELEVTGTLVERHDLPVFVEDPDAPPVAGIPVQPGTDLHEASRRLVLEDVRWRVLP